MEHILGYPLITNIKDDRKIRKSIHRQLPLNYLYPRSRSAREFRKVAEAVGKMWQTVGVQTNIKYISKLQIIELLKNRDYQILLYGEIMGNDPDPFPFWHSSQTNYPGLNLALFSDRDTDKILEQARSNVSDQERVKLYGQFQKILLDEIPAIFPYTPTHNMIINNGIKGIKTEDGSYGSKIRNVYNPILIYRKKLVGSELNNWSLYRTNLLNLEDTRQVYKGDHSSIVRKFEETGKGHMQSETKSNTFSKLNRTEWVPNSRGALPTNIQYCPRAAKEEKTVNNTINNPHVSVKPLGILSWLVKLLTNSSNQLVADIYCGTGSLGVVCRKLNRPFLGIEMDLETVEIAKYRIKHTFDLDDKYFNNIKPI